MHDNFTLSHAPGDHVTIVTSGLSGRVMNCIIGGSPGSLTVLYTVRYWTNGDMYSADFNEDELKKKSHDHHITIGFSHDKHKSR